MREKAMAYIYHKRQATAKLAASGTQSLSGFTVPGIPNSAMLAMLGHADAPSDPVICA